MYDPAMGGITLAAVLGAFGVTAGTTLIIFIAHFIHKSKRKSREFALLEGRLKALEEKVKNL